ncbi:hypothetical protein ATER59S_00409 [Aquamicrobium terrae]
MADELKDISVVLNGDDPLTDSVVAGTALRLAHHFGAMLAGFEQANTELDSPSWRDDDDDGPYAAVDFCGLSKPRESERYLRSSAMAELRREARHSGSGWHKGVRLHDLVPTIRCSDLVVVGSPLSQGRWLEPDPADIVLTAGRPVLLVPRKFAQLRPSQRKIGHRALIAWNASAPSARAIHDALPLLRLAEEVTLLFISHDKDTQPAQKLLAMIAAHLNRHGLHVRPELIPSDGTTAAQTILDRLSALDINLLVMGAFSRSKLSETWFGGASEDLFHEVGIPILTAH